MVFYVRMGEVPRYRHTFDDRNRLLREELFGEEGFDGTYSLLYHEGEPTRVSGVEEREKPEFDPVTDSITVHRHFRTSLLTRKGDFVSGRRYLLHNARVRIGITKPEKKMQIPFRHALSEQLFFIQSGKAKFHSIFGSLKVSSGDYLYVPKGTTYAMTYDNDLVSLFLESFDRMDIPKRYLNRYGQLREGTPYYTRDIRIPSLEGNGVPGLGHDVLIDYDTRYLLEKRKTSLFDVVGWDGYLFPFALNVNDMAPVVGKLHQPPPVHETLSGKSFMVGTFLPRLFDFHPRSIPISYYHNNIDTDEFLFYSSGNFMSRKGIEAGAITLHVRGIIHGPQPGAVEASIGAKSTDETAVMIEAYDPLLPTKTSLEIEDRDYMNSWNR